MIGSTDFKLWFKILILLGVIDKVLCKLTKEITSAPDNVLVLKSILMNVFPSETTFFLSVLKATSVEFASST